MTGGRRIHGLIDPKCRKSSILKVNEAWKSEILKDKTMDGEIMPNDYKQCYQSCMLYLLVES